MQKQRLDLKKGAATMHTQPSQISTANFTKLPALIIFWIHRLLLHPIQNREAKECPSVHFKDLRRVHKYKFRVYFCIYHCILRE